MDSFLPSACPDSEIAREGWGVMNGLGPGAQGRGAQVWGPSPLWLRRNQGPWGGRGSGHLGAGRRGTKKEGDNSKLCLFQHVA